MYENNEHACVCIYLCVLVCMYVCSVCMSMCMCVCMYVCVCMCVYVCLHVCVCVCLCFPARAEEAWPRCSIHSGYQQAITIDLLMLENAAALIELRSRKSVNVADSDTGI